MKQRLVGTLVLGSLALILIPLLLDGEGVERPPLSATIPPAPVFDTAPLPAPERPQILADTLASDTAPAADPALATPADADPAVAGAAQPASPVEATPAPEPEDSAATPLPAAPPLEVVATEPAPEATAPEPEAAPPVASATTPTLGADGLPEAWAVRLGSFGNRANADALVARLLLAGHKAYIRPVVTAQGTLSGVFVGPVLTRSEAATLGNELKAGFQINDVLVQRYDIAQ